MTLERSTLKMKSRRERREGLGQHETVALFANALTWDEILDGPQAKRLAASSLGRRVLHVQFKNVRLDSRPVKD